MFCIIKKFPLLLFVFAFSAFGQNSDSLQLDESFIHNRIKSEIAGTIWGKDESASIRLALDNQVSEAIKYFNEANAFLGYRN